MKTKKDQLLDHSRQETDNVTGEKEASSHEHNSTTLRIQEIRKMFFKVSHRKGLEEAVTFLNNVAEAYRLAGNHIEAIAAWEGSIQWHPYQIKASIDLAREYEKVGDHESAMKTVRKVVDLMPPEEQAQVISSCISAISGDEKLAIILLGADGFRFSGSNPGEFWRYRKEDGDDMEDVTCLSETNMGEIVEMLSARGEFRELTIYQRGRQSEG